jgi:ATP-binding cassette subfamily B protein
VVIIPIILIGRKVRAKSKQSQNTLGVLTEFSNEILQALKTVQSYTQEKMMADLYHTKISQMTTQSLSYIKLRAGLTAFVIAIVFTAIGIVLWRGGHDVLAGRMTAGELSSFILYAIFMVGAVGALSEEISAFNRAAGAIERILEIFKMEPEAAQTKMADNIAVKGKIIFDHVSFSYPQRPDEAVLNDISFTIEANKTVAIVGPSGAGKTTVFLLLQKFFVPARGDIFIDNHKISGFSDFALRQQMALVSQDVALFAMSVHDNIAFGATREVSRDEIMRAAEEAHIHDEIMALPHGYDTILMPQGQNLSGGQRQRLAIARAIIRESKILLLDEATSALDAENERHIQAAIQSVKGGRTVIVIAHRLSTVRNADHIIVMEQGRIVDEGTHDDLMQKGGLYYKLASLQFTGG